MMLESEYNSRFCHIKKGESLNQSINREIDVIFVPQGVDSSGPSFCKDVCMYIIRSAGGRASSLSTRKYFPSVVPTLSSPPRDSLCHIATIYVCRRLSLAILDSWASICTGRRMAGANSPRDFILAGEGVRGRGVPVHPPPPPKGCRGRPFWPG